MYITANLNDLFSVTFYQTLLIMAEVYMYICCLTGKLYKGFMGFF